VQKAATVPTTVILAQVRAVARAASGASVPALKVAMHRALKALKGTLGPK